MQGVSLVRSYYFLENYYFSEFTLSFKPSDVETDLYDLIGLNNIISIHDSGDSLAFTLVEIMAVKIIAKARQHRP